jgi:hypothetical protein
MSDALMIRCVSCGATNRVPLEKLEQRRQPVCGRCQAALPAAERKPVTVTVQRFRSRSNARRCRCCSISGRRGVGHAGWWRRFWVAVSVASVNPLHNLIVTPGKLAVLALRGIQDLLFIPRSAKLESSGDYEPPGAIEICDLVPGS